MSCKTILFHLGAVSNVQMFGPISSTFRWDHSTKNSAADPIFTETWSLLYLYFLFFCEKRFVVVCIILTSAFSTSHSSFFFFLFFLVFTCCSKMRWQFIHRLSMKKNSRIFRFINCPSSILSHCECLPAKCLRV